MVANVRRGAPKAGAIQRAYWPRAACTALSFERHFCDRQQFAYIFLSHRTGRGFHGRPAQHYYIKYMTILFSTDRQPVKLDTMRQPFGAIFISVSGLETPPFRKPNGFLFLTGTQYNRFDGFFRPPAHKCRTCYDLLPPDELEGPSWRLVDEGYVTDGRGSSEWQYPSVILLNT